MSTTSASQDDKPQVLVWDMPVRVFHWLMVFCFFGAFITSESERYRLLHVTLGYTMGGLVAFRLLWGFAGTRYARFAQFIKGPSAVLHYLKSLVNGEPQHYLGHNPAGAVAIVLILLGTVLTVITGYMAFNDLGGHTAEEAHELFGNAMMAIVIVHFLGVVVSSWLHKERLVPAMIHGRKPAAPLDGIATAKQGIALVLLVAALGYWGWEWAHRPVNTDAQATAQSSKQEQKQKKRERKAD